MAEENNKEEFWETDEVSRLKGLKMFSWNIRSLFPKIDSVREFIRIISCDIICFNETWLKPDVPDGSIQIDGFTVVRNDRVGKRGGGNCIYVRNNIRFDVLCETCTCCKDIEIQCIRINGNDQPHPQKPIIVVLVYRPPGGDNEKAADIISEKLNEMSNLENAEIVILGDLNWDCLSGVNGTGKYIGKLCEEFGLDQIIECPTRISFTKNTLLDVIMTNVRNISHSGCVNINLSDHLPVFFIKKRLSVPVEFEYVTKRSFKNYNSEIFGEILADIDWSVIDLLRDVDLVWDMVYKGLLKEVDSLCPYRE